MLTVRQSCVLLVAAWLIAAGNAHGAEPSRERPLGATSPPRIARREPVAAGLRTSVGNVPAQARMYTLLELESLARQNNPTLAQASARVRAARGKWVQDGLYPNPILRYRGDEIGNGGTAGFQGAAVSQEIVTAKKRQLGQYSDAHLIQQAEQEFATQEFRVRTDVRIQYYAVLLAQRSVELTDQLTTIVQNSTKAATDLYKAQEASRIDVLQSSIEVETVGIQAEKARNAHIAAWRRLAAVTGLADLPLAQLDGDLHADLKQFGWEESLERVMSASPELSAADSRVEAARWAVQRANAERHPNVEVEVARLHDNQSRFDVTSVMVGLPLPIFNRNQGNIQIAYAELRAAQAEVERVSLELRQRLATVYERYANARQQVDRYEQRILPNAQESLELVTTSYKAGQSNILSLLIAQRTVIQAQTAHLESLRELRETSLLLEGMLLADSLSVRMK